jgi:hypothetical protein
MSGNVKANKFQEQERSDKVVVGESTVLFVAPYLIRNFPSVKETEVLFQHSASEVP